MSKPKPLDKSMNKVKKEEPNEMLDDLASPCNGSEKPKKGCMSISETKLGVTLVISKEDCEKLGINQNTTTKEAIKQIRKKIGLGE